MKNCNQCGKCCTRYGGGDLSASSEEIEWWDANRPDIASHVVDGKIWISPVTGEQMTRCPWLRKLPGQKKYICRIYHDRPDECRHYPTRISEMVRDECEMLQPRDLRNRKSAQKELDRMMADSRPPVNQ